MTAEAPTIHRALAAVMADVDKISKDKRNQQQGFNFRGIDDVMNVLHGPLVKHGVIVLPTVEERLIETRPTRNSGTMNVVHLRVRYDFFGPAGDSVSAVVWGEAQDSADKATNKALSAAMKYAMLQTFCVPTDDMPDADADEQPSPTTAKGMRAAQKEAAAVRNKTSEGANQPGNGSSGHTPSDPSTGRDYLRGKQLDANAAAKALRDIAAAKPDQFAQFKGISLQETMRLHGEPLVKARLVWDAYLEAQSRQETLA